MDREVEEQAGANGGLEKGDIRRRRVLRGIPTAPVPALGRRLWPAKDARTDELNQETTGRDRFQKVTPTDLLRAPETLVRRRLTSSGVIRHTDRDARRTSLSGWRARGRRPP